MKWKIVFLICIAFSLFLISPTLSTLFKTPPNTVNMMVGHYFEDYYEYLSFVKQGQKGSLILTNLFDSGDRSNLFSPWWPYSFLGYISFLFHLDIPPSLIYWTAAAVFSFILLLLTFIAVSTLLKKEKFLIQLLAFLLIIISCGFFNIFDTLKDPAHKIIPYDFWYSAGSPFSRYHIGTPHHQITHIIFLLMVLFAINRFHKPLKLTTVVGYFIFSFLLLILSPPQLLLFWLAYLMATIVVIISHLFAGGTKNPEICGEARLLSTPTCLSPDRSVGTSLGGAQKDLADLSKSLISKLFLPFLTTAILLVPLAYFLYKYSFSSPTYIATKLWDIHNLYYPQLSLFILTCGPLILLAPLGLAVYFSRLSFEKLFFFFITFFSFLFVLVPFNIFSTNTSIFTFIGIHNQRFNTPASYLFLGVATILLLKAIFKKPRLILTISFLLLIFISLSLFGSWQIHAQNIYRAGFLQFMPKELYLGLQVLEKEKDETAVLASPQSFLGIIIPAISGKRVYIGRSIFTLNLEEKTTNARKFYSLKMTPSEALDFLKKEKIGFILLTNSEPNEKEFLEHYNFLKVEFKNSQLTILRPLYSIKRQPAVVKDRDKICGRLHLSLPRIG